ncbi:hypothetical protein O3P69_005369 [Scylla paramamosain]|uniref:Secreted protein n=1 Tax=Scylla paramamosain TaxID=85552 RepID=A0AAW0UC37_SCYPA
MYLRIGASCTALPHPACCCCPSVTPVSSAVAFTPTLPPGGAASHHTGARIGIVALEVRGCVGGPSSPSFSVWFRPSGGEVL